MVNFNFGLGNTKAQDDAQTTQDPVVTDPQTANNSNTGDDGTNPSVVTTDNTTSVEVPQESTVENPFETNIPSAEADIFVTPPAVENIEPIIESNEQIVQNEIPETITTTPATENTNEIDNIFANPVPMASAEPVIETPIVEQAVVEQGETAIPTTEEPKPFAPIFENTPTPEITPTEAIDVNPFANQDTSISETQDIASQPFVEPTQTETQQTPQVSENNVNLDFNPFENSENINTETIAETENTQQSEPEFNPFAAEETPMGSEEKSLPVETSTDEEVEKPVDIDFNPFATNEPNKEDTASSTIEETPIETNTVNTNVEEIKEPEMKAGLDFNPFAEETIENNEAKAEVEEKIETPSNFATGNTRDDSNQTQNGTNDPLQTLLLVKADIENYIHKQDADIADLNADIDYHKNEIKDLRGNIKEKEKHIKEKKTEFEKMIKDIEKTLSTKFSIKK